MTHGNNIDDDCSSSSSQNSVGSNSSAGTGNGNSNGSVVGPDDCLLGRGGKTNSHEGNRRFRQLVLDHQAEYLNARKTDKSLIARRIVEIVHGRGGRFLRKAAAAAAAEAGSEEVCVYVEVPDKKAVEKTSQALREGLDVRNKTIRPSKMYYGGAGVGKLKKNGKARKLKSEVVAGKVVASAPTPTTAANASNPPSPSLVSVGTAAAFPAQYGGNGVRRLVPAGIPGLLSYYADPYMAYPPPAHFFHCDSAEEV